MRPLAAITGKPLTGIDDHDHRCHAIGKVAEEFDATAAITYSETMQQPRSPDSHIRSANSAATTFAITWYLAPPAITRHHPRTSHHHSRNHLQLNAGLSAITLVSRVTPNWPRSPKIFAMAAITGSLHSYCNKGRLRWRSSSRSPGIHQVYCKRFTNRDHPAKAAMALAETSAAITRYPSKPWMISRRNHRTSSLPRSHNHQVYCDLNRTVLAVPVYAAITNDL